MDIKEYTYNTLSELNINTQDITPEIALESALLPGDLHGDPADRILIATAKKIGAALITRDKEILTYSKKHGLTALSL